MNTVDLFGRQSKKLESSLKLLSNGRLNSINDSLSVNVDPNINIIRLSANVLMATGLKLSGDVMTGNLSVGGNRITDLNADDPLNPQDAVTKNYVGLRKTKSICRFIPVTQLFIK